MGRLESLSCDPQELNTGPLPAPHPAFVAPGCTLSLRSGHRAGFLRMGPGRTLHPKKITNSLMLHRVSLHPPSPQRVPSLPPNVSCLPHTAGAGPSHRPGQVPPDLALHLASQEKGKPLVTASSPQNTPVIPSTREQLRAGDKHCPLASRALDLAHQAATGSIFIFPLPL